MRRSSQMLQQQWLALICTLKRVEGYNSILVLLPSDVTLMFSALAMDLFASQSTFSTLMSGFSSHNLHNCSRA